jgi:hypothetical protein
MCFNASVSWATAALGIATFIFAKFKGKQACYYVAPAYFGLMEIIQGLMYFELQHSSERSVIFLVYLAYLHVCFQPLVFNYWLGIFILPEKRQIYDFSLKLSFVGGLLLFSRIFVTDITPLCSSFEALCNATPKIYYGFHHIAWALPLTAPGWSYITPSIALHMFLFFVPGFLFGLYRFMLLMIIMGPFLSSLISVDSNEQPAIWCVIGLWLLALTVWAVLYNKLPRWLLPSQKNKYKDV